MPLTNLIKCGRADEVALRLSLTAIKRRGAMLLTRALVGPGLSEAAMHRHPRLRDFFRVTALATDRDGGVYVANLEAKDYPITATQWHPVRPACVQHPTPSVACLHISACASMRCLAAEKSWRYVRTSTWSQPIGASAYHHETSGAGVTSRLSNVLSLCICNMYTFFGMVTLAFVLGAGKERIRVCSPPAHPALTRSGELLLAKQAR